MKNDIPPNPGSGNWQLKEEALPGYQAVDDAPPDMVASFANLNLGRKERKPTADECIAHLKLLEAISQLRDDVGMTDGLYGLFDRMADGVPEGDKRTELLGKIREKRWAVYVTIAARRFETWFQTIEPGTAMCTLGLMESEQYREVHTASKALEFTKDSLPPLDVVMVWHSFCLNPRKFLSDCIRHNKIGLWRAGMPWQAIVEAIDNHDFSWNASETTQKAFTSGTGLAWNHLDGEPSASIECSRCKRINKTELTTTVDQQFWTTPGKVGEGGTGYADTGFGTSCSCGLTINHEVLRAQRFRKDLQKLLVHQVPMPARQSQEQHISHELPNRLLISGAGAKIADVTQLSRGPRAATFEELNNIYSVDDIRKEIETAIKDKDIVKRASVSGVSRHIMREERIAIRRMMSCYWDNSSIFSLDLIGAIIRQNVFVQKMHDIDWLHSPAIAGTMQRLIKKYENFFQIMKQHPSDVAVPTLNVDLAWHTHQLSPVWYRDYSIRHCNILIDHDDKIDENKLSNSFEWTSKTYEKMFGEVYSECTCWYCEAIREAHTSRMSRLFKSGKDPVSSDLDRLHSNGASDPHKSPHISAHNAIKSERNPDTKTAVYVKTRQLERNYQKAV